MTVWFRPTPSLLKAARMFYFFFFLHISISFHNSRHAILHAQHDPLSSPVFVYKSRFCTPERTLELQSPCRPPPLLLPSRKQTNDFMLLQSVCIILCDDLLPLFIYLFFSWPEDAQEEMSIFKVSDQGTGEGVLFQRLHQQREAPAALADAQSNRSPGQNLVSEQEDEGEETEQRPFTVLHHKPPAIKKTEQRLSQPCHPPPRLHVLPEQDGEFFHVPDFIKNSTIYTIFCH